MISLIFKILADATGFNKTIKTDLPATAKEGGKKAGNEAGGSFGKEFGNQVKGAVMSVIGAGAILGAVKNQITNAAKLTKEAAKEGIPVEAMRELEIAAEAVGMSVEELRSAAPLVVRQFIELMDAVKASGGIIDEATVKQLAELNADLKNLSSSVAVVIGPIVKVVSATLEVMLRTGRVIGGSAANLGGMAVGNRELRQAGLEEIHSAMTSPLASFGSGNNRVSSAAGAFNTGVQNWDEGQYVQDKYKLGRFTEFSKRLTSMSGTAGTERDASIFSMIPGASKELLQAIKDNTGKMESIKQTMEKKL